MHAAFFFKNVIYTMPMFAFQFFCKFVSVSLFFNWRARPNSRPILENSFDSAYLYDYTLIMLFKYAVLRCRVHERRRLT